MEITSPTHGTRPWALNKEQKSNGKRKGRKSLE